VNTIFSVEFVGLFLQYFFIFLCGGYLIGVAHKKAYLLISLVVVLLISFVYFILDVLATGVLWGALSLVLLRYSRKVDISFFSSSMPILLYILSDYLIVYLLSSAEIMNNLVFRFIVGTLLYFSIIYLFKKIINRFSYFFKSSSFTLLILAVTSSLTVIVYLMIISIERAVESGISMEKTNSIFIVVYALVSALVCAAIIYAKSKVYVAREKQKELIYLLEYLDQIESNYNEIRKFKHDYKNILISVESFLESNDIQGLKKYFYKEIKQTAQIIDLNSFKLSQLSNLQVKELKSLLANKLMVSQEKGIDTEIEMREKIKSIPVDSVVLVRSLGIILDNAIEAAEEIKNGYIRVAILHDKNLIKIIVANSCKQDIPKLFLLKRDGFSTKGENRGLGLGNLDQLLNKSKNIILETKIEKSVFTQVLTINEEGKV